MRRGWIAAVLVAAAALPLSGQSGNLSDRSSRDWRRLTSANVDVVGNAPESELRRAADRIEAFRAVLQAALPRLQVASVQRTRVYVFRNYGSFEKFVPRDGRGRRLQGVGGYFFTAPAMNVMALPIYETQQETYQTAFHEYTHYLVSKNVPNPPVWLNEGLADFYSTIDIDDKGKVIIGRAHPLRMAWLQGENLPPLRMLLTGESARRLFVGGGTSMFYAHSWVFVHYLLLGDGGKHRPQLVQYLNLLRTSTSIDDAAAKAFGSVDDLDRELRTYFQRSKLPALLVNGSFGAGPAVPVVAVTESEAALLQGELLTTLGAFNDAEPQLQMALTLSPQLPRARLLLGRVRIGQERVDDGVKMLNALADEQPRDFEAHYYLGEALRAAGRAEDELKEFERAVAINSDSAEAWFGLSLAALSLHRDSQSDAAMRQVIRLDGQPGWFYSHARAALVKGSNEIAARDVQQYLQSMGWAEESGPYAAFVGVIASWRLGQQKEAAELLDQVAEAAPPKSWVGNIADYLKGSLGEDDFLGRAKDNGQRTEAHTYIAFKRLQAGDKDAALKHFLWVKERGEHTYTEHQLALGELKRLSS